MKEIIEAYRFFFWLLWWYFSKLRDGLILLFVLVLIGLVWSNTC